jgi:hypothetical protein
LTGDVVPDPGDPEGVLVTRPLATKAPTMAFTRVAIRRSDIITIGIILKGSILAAAARDGTRPGMQNVPILLVSILLSVLLVVLLQSTRLGTTLDPVDVGEGRGVELGTRIANIWGHSFHREVTKQLKTKYSAFSKQQNFQRSLSSLDSIEIGCPVKLGID